MKGLKVNRKRERKKSMSTDKVTNRIRLRDETDVGKIGSREWLE